MLGLTNAAFGLKSYFLLLRWGGDFNTNFAVVLSQQETLLRGG